MAKVLKLIYKELYYYIHDCKETRTEDYFLLGSPIKVLSILGLYLYFVKVWGPKFMKNREPFQLNGVMKIYNFIQIIVNAVLAILGLGVAIDYGVDTWLCVPRDYPQNQEYIFRLIHAYYLLKLFDLLDTVFFILRKKYNQVTFLHVYHHFMIALSAYIAAQYLPGGQVTFQGLANVYVHAVMYFYYYFTSLKPELKNNIWWKKYITQFQMLQFFLVMVYFSIPFFLKSCSFPKFWLILGVIQNGFMLLMFGDFYYKAYIKNKDNKKNICD